jgi:hypothetical protein
MTLDDFVSQIPNFASSSHSEKIKAFGWYLHVYENKDRFDPAVLRECYDIVNAPQPTNIHPYLKLLVESRPPILLRDKRGYRLEARVREVLNQQYAGRRRKAVVSKLLSDLPAKIPALAERAFLEEAIICYSYDAFRAAIVMAWNLAYDHLLDWISIDSTRLLSFNNSIGPRFPKLKGFVVASKTSFEELKESQVIAICSSAKLFSKNIARILEEKLTRRNMAAHPSPVVITQPQAEDVISDLVHNVVLALK